MVIKIFIFLFMFFSIIAYMSPIHTKNKQALTDDIALVTFYDSIMYTLDINGINRFIVSKKVERYKTKDLMYNGIVTIQKKSKDKKIFDYLSADFIEKKENQFKFNKNVVLKRDAYITLNTNELLYNMKTNIAHNSTSFKAYYYENYLKGNSFFLNLEQNYMRAKSTHFEIDHQEKKGIQ